MGCSRSLPVPTGDRTPPRPSAGGPPRVPPDAGLPRTPPKVPRPTPAPLVDSPAVAALRAGLSATHPEATGSLLEEFWRTTAARTPLIESVGDERADPAHRSADERVVTFLWRDETADRVLVFVNRLTDERNLADSLMCRVPGTDVWHLSYRMDADWRASYAFLRQEVGEPAPWVGPGDQAALRAALDRGRPDPRNPEWSRNAAGVQQSVVALPDASAQPWLRRRSWVRTGTVTPYAAPDGRPVWVYLPPGPVLDAALPLLVVFDGNTWLVHQDLPTTLDNLIADGDLPPVAAVLLDSGDRAERWARLDLDGGADRYVTEKLLPWACAEFPVTADPARTVVAGQSLGGLSALLTGTASPDRVGAVIAQSASLWHDGALDRLGGVPAAGLRVYLEVGRQEWVLREPNRRLGHILAATGADVKFVEFNGGHDYACWRGGIADGLRWISRDWWPGTASAPTVSA